MLLRTHASKALRCLLPAATSSARAAGSVGASSTAETSVPVAAAAAARLHQRRSASAAGGASDRGQTQSKGGSLSDDAPAAVDPDTGLTYSVPPDRQMRDTVEEVTIYQLEELLAAKTGIAADPEVRAAAEAALETLSVCETCSQELDEAGEWESLLSSAGLINSPADYTQSSQGSGSEAGDGGAAKSPGSGSML